MVSVCKASDLCLPNSIYDSCNLSEHIIFDIILQI